MMSICLSLYAKLETIWLFTARTSSAHLDLIPCFGEGVDMYEGGKIVSYEGSRHAGVDDAEAGVIIPGTV